MAGRKKSMPTQCDRIVQYLKDNGTITRLQAVYDLGVMELAARICELEEKGYSFNKKTIYVLTRYGYEVTCTEYSIKS